MQHPQWPGVASIQIDVLLITLFTQMEGINIAVVHGNGVWATDENMLHTVALVYLRNGEFLPTQKCTNPNTKYLNMYRTLDLTLSEWLHATL